MKSIHYIIGFFFLFINHICAFTSPSPGTRLWNIAADIQELSCIIESQVCTLLPQIETDFFGTFTVIEGIIEKELTIESQLDVIESAISTISFNEEETLSALDIVLQLTCTIDSKIDPLNSALDTLQECFGFPITNELIGTAGFTITATGYYYLPEDIFFEPGSTGLAAITIDSNNVWLDMKNKQISSDATALTTGVEIITTHTNVHIFDGTLIDLTGNGITVGIASNTVLIDDLIIKDTSFVGIDIKSSCTNVQIQNSMILDNASTGILGNKSEAIAICNCNISNNGLDGIGLSNCAGICVIDCIVNKNTSNGIDLSSTNTASIIECTIWDNGIHGISGQDSFDSVILNCYLKGNTMDGIRLTDCTRFSIQGNCLERNGNDNIQLATDSSGTSNCYVGQNSMMLTTSVNLREASGSFDNGIFGNYALADNEADNYVSIGGGSFINKSIIDQSGAFPVTEPTFWVNISMTT